MKKNILVIAALIFALTALLISVGALTGWVNAGARQQTVRWGNPMVVSYQGQIWEDGTPYDGEGYFKFAIVDGSGDTQVWSIDGYEPPAGYVPLNVENGFFSVLLGDITVEGMDEPLPPEVFYETDRMVRVWFSTDPDAETWEYTQMPDQTIAAVPYAYNSGSAAYAQHLGPYQAEEYQLLVTGTCPEGQMIQEIVWDGSVVCSPPLATNATFTSSFIDDGSYTMHQPSVAIGSDGLGLIVYEDTSVDDLKVAHCDDINCTSATINKLDDLGPASPQPSIAIGSDGLGLIVYWNATNVKVAHCGNLDCSTASISTLPTGEYYPIGQLSLAIGVDDLGIISYAILEDSIPRLQIAHCSNISCSENAIYTLSSITNAQYISLVIGADGYPLLAYQDFAYPPKVKIVHCEDLYCFTSSSHFIDISTTSNGYGIDITIGADGLGIISYTDLSSNALKIAHCLDAECTTSEVSFIDQLDSSLVWDGLNTSITLGRDGLPLIVFYTNTLKIAHCSDINCRYADVFGLPGPDDGKYLSIAKGEDGLGLIASGGWGHLHVIHCSNELCAPINFKETP